MSEKLVEPRPSILLFGEDPRLVETRQWVLQAAGYRIMTALKVADLERTAAQERVDLFLLCDSLHPKIRSQALVLLHSQFPQAKRLVLTANSRPVEPGTVEPVFPAIEGPGKLIVAIHNLMVQRVARLDVGGKGLWAFPV